jgi:hypothetical protein
MITTKAWGTHRGPDRDDNVPPAELRLEPFSFPDIERFASNAIESYFSLFAVNPL